jgi:hypothetical protein
VWKVPTFSAREWRSAALEVDGANGSWTWHTSSGRIVRRFSIVRETSTGSAGARRALPGRSGSASPTASTRGGAPGAGSSDAGSSRAALSACRVSRTASLEREGATMSTWCPRAARTAVVRST